MPPRNLLVLRRVASHALDRQKRAIREQTEAVETLEGALARIDRETKQPWVVRQREYRGLG
jgi:hypothetical protein